TGIKGDGITSNRRPRLTGTADPNVIIELLDASNNVLATTTTDAGGNYLVQLPNDLNNGTIALAARSLDTARNLGPASLPLTLSIVTVQGDFNDDGTSDPGVFERVSSSSAAFIIPNITPPGGLSFGSGTLDIPLPGDVNGDGKADYILFRPSTATWYID